MILLVLLVVLVNTGLFSLSVQHLTRHADWLLLLLLLWWWWWW